MNCPNCNSEQVMDGILNSYHNTVFIEKGTENKFRPNAYKVRCKACKDCGTMFAFAIVLKKKSAK